MLDIQWHIKQALICISLFGGSSFIAVVINIFLLLLSQIKNINKKYMSVHKLRTFTKDNVVNSASETLNKYPSLLGRSESDQGDKTSNFIS